MKIYLAITGLLIAIWTTAVITCAIFNGIGLYFYVLLGGYLLMTTGVIFDIIHKIHLPPDRRFRIPSSSGRKHYLDNYD
jgi:hypothetical protein